MTVIYVKNVSEKRDFVLICTIGKSVSPYVYEIAGFLNIAHVKTIPHITRWLNIMDDITI